MDLFLRILIAFISSLLLTLSGSKIIQILQLSSYKNKGVIGWLGKDKYSYLTRYFALAFFSFISMLAYVACFNRFKYISYLGFIFFIILHTVFIFVTVKQNKVPLKYTPRVWRLMICCLMIFGLISYPLIFIGRFIALRYSLIGLIPLVTPFIILLGNLIMKPLEKTIAKKYIRQAKKKLSSMPQLIKIGITGSYGKTTAKNILATLLEAKYKVCKSPESYNTPMGLTKTINNILTPDCEVFVAEMGARFVGDIKELTDIVQPKIGIITSLGPMHLETFKTYDNIIKTKNELIEALPKDGIAFFGGENADLKVLFEKASIEKYLALDYTNVRFSEKGTSFDLIIDDTNIEISLALLGKFIPDLFSLCALVAFKLGITKEQIAEQALKIRPVPHRLELSQNGLVTIIDDSFNSNPEGAKSALEILNNFEGIKIIITPGMVELGEKQREINYTFGKQIAKVCDFAFVLGANADVIINGAIDAGMDKDKIITAASLEEATMILNKIISGRKVILFENDLPDNY